MYTEKMCKDTVKSITNDINILRRKFKEVSDDNFKAISHPFREEDFYLELYEGF